MGYEDWTYRETEVRLREHGELRNALGNDRVPDYTTLYRCLRRLHEEDLTPLLDEAIRRMPPAPAEGTTVAVDATGLTPGAISTFFVNCVRDRGQYLPRAHLAPLARLGDRRRSAQTAHARPNGPPWPLQR